MNLIRTPNDENFTPLLHPLIKPRGLKNKKLHPLKLKGIFRIITAVVTFPQQFTDSGTLLSEWVDTQGCIHPYNTKNTPTCCLLLDGIII